MAEAFHSPAKLKQAWWRRALRFLLVALGVVIFLGAVAAGFLALLGAWEWHLAQVELAARGEKLTVAEWELPPVPAGQNFFDDPLWAEKNGKPKVQEDGEYGTFVPERAGGEGFDVFTKKLSPEEIDMIGKNWPRLAGINFSDSRLLIMLNFLRENEKHDEVWRSDAGACTLTLLKPAESLMARVNVLLARPGARYPVSYFDGIFPLLTHMTRLQSLAHAFYLRACAEVQEAQGDAAARDVLTLLGLSRTTQDDPIEKSSIWFGPLLFALTVIDRGISAHAWSEANLAALDEPLRKVELLPPILTALRRDRATKNMQLVDHDEYFRKMMKDQRSKDRSAEYGERSVRDWLLIHLFFRTYFVVLARSDQADANRLMQKILDAAEVRSWRGLNSDPAFQNPNESISLIYTLRYMLTKETFWTGSSALQRGAFYQDAVVQGRLAIALERYRLAHKAYPESLDALVPDYLPKLPPQILSGQPMHYKRTEVGSFLLWADGWDGKDGGGKTAQYGYTTGDWVWAKHPQSSW